MSQCRNHNPTSALITMQLKLLDRPPRGWFALDVIKQARKWDWLALMVDVDPDQLRSCVCDFPALFYVNPADYLPEGRPVHQCLVRIPGKHRNADAAWQAIRDLIGRGMH